MLSARDTETTEAFVKRVRPSCTTQSRNNQWIVVKAPMPDEDNETTPTQQSITKKDIDQIPEFQPSNMYTEPVYVSPLDACVAECQALLARYCHVYSLSKPGPKPRVPEEVKAEVIRALYSSAVRNGQTVGKWMLFPKVEEADDVWEKVALATSRGELGTSAKIAPCQDSSSNTTLICVYCDDFSDEVECKRVLEGIKALGLVVTAGFKADILTHLGLYGADFNKLQLGRHWKLHRDILHEVFPSARN